MIFCKHCAKKISTKKASEAGQVLRCPNCGKEVSAKLEENEIRPLVQKLHKNNNYYRNRIDTGLSFIVIGLTLAIIGLIFYYLAFKLAAADPNDPSTKTFILNRESSEYWVFVVGVGVGGLLFVGGLTLSLTFASMRRATRLNVEYIRAHKTAEVPPVESIFAEWNRKIKHYFLELRFRLKTRSEAKKAAKEALTHQ